MALLQRLALLLVLLVPAAIAAGTNPVHIAAVEEDEGTERTFETIMREAYRRIGQPVEVAYMPASRGLMMANTGKSDALLARLPVIEEAFPNMRRVPTPIGAMTFLAVSLKPEVKVQSWEEMRNLNIGIRRGYRIAEIKTAGMKVNLVDTYESMFKMLVQDRVDVLVIREPGLGPTLHKLRAGGVLNGSEHFRSAVVEYLPAYHYLHASRSDLIPQLDQALKAMQKEGFMERARREEAGN